MNSQTKDILGVNEKNTFWGDLFLNLFAKIEFGNAELILPLGKSVYFEGSIEGESIQIVINDWKSCESVFMKGDIGLGESYIEGLWDTPDISKVIKFGIQNAKSLEKVIKGSLHKIIFYRIKHLLNRNTKKGSSKNIHAHYDLGNQFYELWLDKTMTYSSALYNGNTNLSLQEAQTAKYDNILKELNLMAGDHVLEVGCGWGGFIEHAANKGIKVTGATISKEQYDFAKKRLVDKPELAEVLLRDYRELDGKYDHIVSIEMFEALGESYWKKYFSKLHSLLKTNGKMLIQSITINHKDFKSYRKGTDFIQQYIFPGGMLPSSKIFKATAIKQKLLVNKEIEFGEDYGTTLKEWEINFQDQLNRVKILGFDNRFIRTWKFYLKYCEGGFNAKKIGVSQFVLEKV